MSEKISLFGSSMDRMPDIGFKIMSFMFAIRDKIISVDKKVNKFGISEGNFVIDYGCGPGGYIKRVSELVGENGKVYGADIHELAVESVNKKIEKYNLKNAHAVQINDYKCPLKDNTADLIYALDMFHMVKHPDTFLKELHRLIKKDGRLILEDGHQSRKSSKEKVIESGLWEICSEDKIWIECVPKK